MHGSGAGMTAKSRRHPSCAAAQQALEDVNNNNVAAINALGAFINAVQAQSGVHIPVDDANALIAAAQQIIDVLSS